MEVPDIEFGSQSGLRLAAKLADLELADLVGGGLAGIGDVAVDLAADVEVRQERVFAEESDGAVAAPTLGMQPGVDDQAHGTPGLERQASEIGVGILIEAHLLAQGFGIKAP